MCNFDKVPSFTTSLNVQARKSQLFAYVYIHKSYLRSVASCESQFQLNFPLLKLLFANQVVEFSQPFESNKKSRGFKGDRNANACEILLTSNLWPVRAFQGVERKLNWVILKRKGSRSTIATNEVK